jgi:hypothetical protein
VFPPTNPTRSKSGDAPEFAGTKLHSCTFRNDACWDPEKALRNAQTAFLVSIVQVQVSSCRVSFFVCEMSTLFVFVICSFDFSR